MGENPDNPSLPPTYFDAVYQANTDPWHFETSPYEHAKYAATLAALPQARYERVFEIGCSLGVLTARLASRCGYLLAVDVAEAALAQARARCTGLPQVDIRRMQVPESFPEGQFNLILVSEVGYYWSWQALAQAAEAIRAALPVGGQLLLVHWTPPVHDYPLTGDQVHEYFLQHSGPDGPWRHLLGQREATYRLDLLEKAPQA
ncbi:methyltransferase [Hymenobacter sp. DG25B]|nr:methyltransferase [Hymenobacter sp. DG25B]